MANQKDTDGAAHMGVATTQKNVRDIRQRGVLYNEQLRMSKLSAALYLVTEVLEDNEPLKGHIRHYAAEVLKKTHIGHGAQQKDISNSIKDIIYYIDTLMSFMDLARVVNLVSEMNANIITDELAAIHDLLIKRLQIVNMDTAPIQRPINNNINLSNHAGLSQLDNLIERRQAYVPNHDKLVADTAEANIKIDSISKENLKRNQNPKTTPIRIKDKSSRKEKIISIVNDMKDVTIKDIAMRITGCTEKTLQRDINELVEDGYINKVGNKRWTKYQPL